jgi:hypothetical protein
MADRAVSISPVTTHLLVTLFEGRCQPAECSRVDARSLVPPRGQGHDRSEVGVDAARIDKGENRQPGDDHDENHFGEETSVNEAQKEVALQGDCDQQDERRDHRDEQCDEDPRPRTSPGHDQVRDVRR